MGKVSQKKNNSSIQVLKTLQVLIQGNYSMNELIEILNEKETEPVFNNSVLSKYINTCRYCGMVIPKINNKYYVAKIPFGLDLSVIDVDLLKSLQTYVKDEMSVKCSKYIDAFIEKIDHFSNKQIVKVDKKTFNITVELFELAIAKKCKVKLIFKNRCSLTGIPKCIKEEKGKIYFNVYNKRMRSIELSRLSGVELLGQRYIDPLDGDQVVVFKLSGGLAKRYEARSNEKVELCNDGSIIVTNRNENKELLFSRLLRYDDKCELLQPKIYREEMKILINNMLNNYGVN